VSRVRVSMDIIRVRVSVSGKCLGGERPGGEMSDTHSVLVGIPACLLRHLQSADLSTKAL